MHTMVHCHSILGFGLATAGDTGHGKFRLGDKAETVVTVLAMLRP